LDALLIYINYSILNKIGLQDTFSITINSNGIEKEKNKYREELSNFYADKKHILSPESLINLEKDALLLFDSILEDEQILAKNAPSIIKSLKKDSKDHYQKCKEYLDLLKIPYQENPQLIAKNDYHSHTIWEIREKQSNTLMVS
jgi:histidyl-tRNA synthetase